MGAGAKVLGPLTVGRGARIGSNAVVVKDVPEGATVVGVPGRIIQIQDDAHRKRKEIAEKMGFDAYGTTKDMPDPVATAINRMLDHIHVLDQKIESMSTVLKQSGINVDDSKLPELGHCEIDSTGGQSGGTNDGKR